MIHLLGGANESLFAYSPHIEQLWKNNPVKADGSNITIVILSQNRVVHTRLLLHSIQEHMPFFKGQIVIADNGSDTEQVHLLKKIISEFDLTITLLEFQENYGVSGGRNRAFAACTTEWILSLDNDMFFVANPLPEIQKTVSISGCRFANLAILDSDGKNYTSQAGHLWIHPQEDGRVHCSCGPLTAHERNKDNTTSGFVLSTFLGGTTPFLHRETFLRLGGYDEGYFIGFEDIDFSLTLFKQGYMIANCLYPTLVHNHPKPTRHTKTAYDAMRYSYDQLKKSGDHFFEKNGLVVWDKTTDQYFADLNLELQQEQMAKPSAEEQYAQLVEIYLQAKKNYLEISNAEPSEEYEQSTSEELRFLREQYQTHLQYIKALEESREDQTRQMTDCTLKIQQLEGWARHCEQQLEERQNMLEEQKNTIESQKNALAGQQEKIDSMFTLSIWEQKALHLKRKVTKG